MFIKLKFNRTKKKTNQNTYCFFNNIFEALLSYLNVKIGEIYNL